MLNPLFYAKIRDGKIKLDPLSRKKYKTYINSLEGKEVILRIQKDRPLRTNPQNKYYWGVVVSGVADETGMEPEEVHDAFRWKFLNDPTKALPTAVSTTKLTIDEFTEYVEKCRRFAETELNMIVPLPNEVDLESIFNDEL